jgi:hypothetical protein
VYTFSDGGIEIPAGTNITIGTTQVGQWALHGIVVELSESVTDYHAWAAEWGIASETNDADGDGAPNLYEFAMGGDPVDPADQGIRPAFSRSGNQLIYVYPERADPQSRLIYWLETAETLMPPVWTCENDPSTASSGGLFNFVTNEIMTDHPIAFFRLAISNRF